MAYWEHASQQEWVGFHVYERYHVFSCYKFGLVRSTVGPDVNKDDFMENLSAR